VCCVQGLCCGFVFGDMDSCRDVPQYKVMKFLVFGIISSSLLSELQVMIPKVNHNGVCIHTHTPTRIHMRTHTCSSFKQTDHDRGGIVPADFVQ
jgi:hypothetical protein